MNDGMNECLFNASLICHKECGSKREKKYFFMIPRLQNLHQGSHTIKFLLLSLEKGKMIAIRALTGMQLISNEEKNA